MKDGVFEITLNEKLSPGLYKMTFSGEHGFSVPGQFADIALPEFYLRRPISAISWDGCSFTIVYKTVGKGTEALSSVLPGAKLSVLTGLGNGFDTSLSGDSPLLIGGGVGCAPMFSLATALAAEGKRIRVILGFNTAGEVFYENEFKALGAEVTVVTVDGSYGKKGFPTQHMPEEYSFCYTCGPEPMMKAVYAACKSDAQFSFEERMGCGFGACMGCTCETLAGPKRICKDGPVMRKGELTWQI